MARRSEVTTSRWLLALNYRTTAIVIGEGLLPFGILRKRGLYHDSHSWGRVISKMTRDHLFVQLWASLASGATFSPLSITTHFTFLFVALGCGSKSSKTLGCKQVKGQFISLRSLSLFSRCFPKA